MPFSSARTRDGWVSILFVDWHFAARKATPLAAMTCRLIDCIINFILNSKHLTHLSAVGTVN